MRLMCIWTNVYTSTAAKTSQKLSAELPGKPADLSEVL